MSRDHNYYVYIVASKSGTLYIGVTNDLVRRVDEHKQGAIEGFSKKYGCSRLIFFEHFTIIQDAIVREKQIKKWRRSKKEFLIRSVNPGWKDLSLEWE